jgi:hypothetical protein
VIIVGRIVFENGGRVSRQGLRRQEAPAIAIHRAACESLGLIVYPALNEEHSGLTHSKAP